MTKSGINREVVMLAFPSILANITIPLVGIVDTAIAGHISNAAAIGGIAIGTMLFDLLYWNFGFLRTGTAGMTAQAWGKFSHNPSASKDHYADRAKTATLTEQRLLTPNDILRQSLFIALCGAALILLLQWVFVTVTLWFVPCSAEVAQFARQYFFIRVWAAPATLCLMTLKGWFIGMQNTVVPMVTDLVVNCVNMFASWILAVYTPLGAMGVAWGTLIAQYSGLTVACIILLKKYDTRIKGVTKLSLLNFQLLKLNTNLFVRSLCMMVVYVGFTSLAAKYGDTELAVSAIMMKFFMLFSYFIDGFAYAGEALTGRFIGSKDKPSLRTAVRVLFVWTTAIGLVCTAIYAFSGTDMVRLMTNKPDVIECSKNYMIWLILMPLTSCLAFMWDGVFVGATRGKELRNSMIFSAIGFCLTYILLSERFGIQALYLAYLVHLLVRTAYLTLKWETNGNCLEYKQ